MAPGVTDIVSLVSECVKLALAIDEMKNRVSGIKEGIVHLTRIIIRMEEKISLFFAHKSENDGDSIEMIRNHVYEDLNKIKSELENTSELMKHWIKKYIKSKSMSESMDKAIYMARTCEARIETMAIQKTGTDAIIEEMRNVVKEVKENSKKKEERTFHKLVSDASVAIESLSTRTELFDRNEDESIRLLENLPASLKSIIHNIGMSGLTDQEKKDLALAINEFQKIWAVDVNDIKFDKNIFGQRKFLGSGGFGRVFSGSILVPTGTSDEKRNVNVAVKEVFTHGSRYPTGEILREVLLQMSLRHDNILFTYGLCWMYDENELKSQGLVVMEKMSHNLKGAISSHLITRKSDKFRVIGDITEALIHLHDNGIVHRDVKPENILLNISKEKKFVGFAKLADFGCSRKVLEDKITLMTTISSVASGTPLYSPPEVILNPRNQTRKSWDIWSFGLVVCYVFTGGNIPKFEVSEESARSGKLIKDAQAWAQQITEPKYKNIALKCLHKDEKKRATLKNIKVLIEERNGFYDDTENDNVINSTECEEGKSVIISGSQDRTLRRWCAATGEEIGNTLEGHKDYVRCVAFSPKGDMVVSGSNDKTLRRWNAATGEAIGKPMKGHKKYVSSVVFNSSSEIIVSASYDETLRLWRAKTGEAIGRPLNGHESWITCVAVKPNGDIIASGSKDKNLRLWNSATGESIGDPLIGHSDQVTCIVFNPSGDMIVSGSYDKTLRRWNSETGEAIGRPLNGHKSWVTCVALNPTGKMIISGSKDGTIRRWNAATGESIGEPLKGHSNKVTCIVFNPSGDMIVSGSYDKTLQQWNAATGEAIGRPLNGHESWVTSIVFNPSGSTIISGSKDGTLRRWNAVNGAEIGKPLTGHRGLITSIVSAEVAA